MQFTAKPKQKLYTLFLPNYLYIKQINPLSLFFKGRVRDGLRRNGEEFRERSIKMELTFRAQYWPLFTK
jgi:hypothetical protein